MATTPTPTPVIIIQLCCSILSSRFTSYHVVYFKVAETKFPPPPPPSAASPSYIARIYLSQAEAAAPTHHLPNYRARRRQLYTYAYVYVGSHPSLAIRFS